MRGQEGCGGNGSRSGGGETRGGRAGRRTLGFGIWWREDRSGMRRRCGSHGFVQIITGLAKSGHATCQFPETSTGTKKRTRRESTSTETNIDFFCSKPNRSWFGSCDRHTCPVALVTLLLPTVLVAFCGDAATVSVVEPDLAIGPVRRTKQREGARPVYGNSQPVIRRCTY
jgi:hypothetical protein